MRDVMRHERPPDSCSQAKWNGLIQELFGLAEPYLRARDDLPHAQVSHRYAESLLQQEGGDRAIVEPAVILHDVGWSSLEPREIAAAYGVRSGGEEAERLNRIHEISGASIARGLLDGIDYAPKTIDRIARIIKHHDSGGEADSLEERLVRDADKLWRFSQIGFWKEIERQGLDPEELYAFLSERYQGWFLTATARDLAAEELAERAKEIAQRTKPS